MNFSLEQNVDIHGTMTTKEKIKEYVDDQYQDVWIIFVTAKLKTITINYEEYMKINFPGGNLMYQSSFSPTRLNIFMDLMQMIMLRAKDQRICKLEVLFNTRYAKKYIQ